MKIYPKPYIFHDSDDEFVFSSSLKIKYNENFPYKKTLVLLKELWTNFTGGKSEISFEKDETLALHTFSCGGVATWCETGFEYAVKVVENGFAVCAENWIGLVHAMFSLLQMIQPEKINNESLDKYHITVCEIYDKPAIKTRVFHYSFYPVELEKLQETLRMCAFMKYSHVLVEFFTSVVFDAFKEITATGDYEKFTYTKQQLQPYFEEARALGIEFVPMFNHFGHASLFGNENGNHVVLSQHPELEAYYEPDGWCYCLSNPQLKEKLKKIREELIDLCGDGEFFHIGGDEAYSLGTCDECRKTPIEKLFAGYVNEIASEMKEKGRRVIMWGDSLLEYDKWRMHTDRVGNRYIASEGTAKDMHKALELIDKSIIINDWQYFHLDGKVMTSDYFKEKGFDVIPAAESEVKNTDSLCKAVKKDGFFGFMQTTWTTDYKAIVTVRGGSSSWMENIDDYDSIYELGDHNFVRGYFLMNYRASALLRKLRKK